MNARIGGFTIISEKLLQYRSDREIQGRKPVFSPSQVHVNKTCVGGPVIFPVIADASIKSPAAFYSSVHVVKS